MSSERRGSNFNSMSLIIDRLTDFCPTVHVLKLIFVNIKNASCWVVVEMFPTVERNVLNVFMPDRSISTALETLCAHLSFSWSNWQTRPNEQKQKSFPCKSHTALCTKEQKGEQWSHFQLQSLLHYMKDKLCPHLNHQLSAARGNELIRTRGWPGTTADCRLPLVSLLWSLNKEKGRKEKLLFF